MTTTTEGTSNNDKIVTGSGDDTIDGGAGNDVINAGAGNDTVDGGTGSDVVNAGQGDDLLIYRYVTTDVAKDVYIGGAGTDTLQIFISAAEAQASNLAAQIAEYEAKLAQTGGSSTPSYTFTFANGSTLNVSTMERIQLMLTDPQLTAGTVAIAEGGETILSTAHLQVTDVDSGSHTFTVSVTHGTVEVYSNGVWTPTTTFTSDQLACSHVRLVHDGGEAPPTLNVTVSDGALFDTAVVPISFAPVNDAPTTSNVSLGSSAEDTSVTITASELLANASDIESDSLSVSDLQVVSGGGSVSQNTDGSWTYTPAANGYGPVAFSYTIIDDGTTGGVADPKTVSGTASLTVTPVNDAPVVSGPVTLAAIAEDSGVRLITQAELLANASDVDGPSLTATGLAITAGNGTLVDNGNGTWNYTPALNDDASVSFSHTVSDGSLTAAGSATLDITPVNDAPTTSPVTLTAIAEDSGVRLITQAELLANASDVDGPSLTATGLAITAGNGTLVDNGNGTWSYTPAANDDTSVSFSYTVSDGSLSAPGSASLDITPVNDAPTTTPVTLAAIAEDSGTRLITQAELLANASDVDGPSLTATGLAIASGNGTLVDNGDGTWSYTPASNDDTSVSFTYTVSDGSLTAAGSATLDITPVNDAPVVSGPVTLAAIAEDSGVRLITQAELLANASDVDGPSLTATGLAITAGNGTLVDNGNGTWNYTPALNDDTAVSFSYTVADGSLSAPGSATLDITPVNDAPTTLPVTLTAIAEDSGARLITQAELLANASDVDGPSLTATGLAITAGNGTLVDNGNGTWNYTPALNDDASVSFTYTVSDGSLTAAGSATLDITPVNDAPTTSPVTLTAIAEDSGARLITQAELLANASDVDNASLTATALAIATGNGTLVDNGNGTWNYTPALNDDASVSFTYTVSDGSLTAAGSATLDITPVNDAPTTSPVTLTAIAEDSGARLITQAELLANASDVDNASLTATALAIATGNGTLVDNGNGTWNYTPALNDDASVSFTYTVSDGSLTAAGSATLDITPVNDAPTTSPVTLTAIAEDSGVRLITQAELLANASDVDGPSLTATSLAITAGNGTLVDNGNGTWNYTPALNDDASVSFTYTVSDGSLTAAGSATLDITPVNDAPTTSPVTLTAIAEDSGARLITQAELLANASDVDNASLTATALAIATGNGTLVDNGNGTWNYTPALNDDASVSFTYTVSDGSLTAAGSATLDITPVNDAPVVSGPVTLAAIAEDSGVRLITQAELLANASDVDGPSLTATGLAITAGNGTLVDNGNGTWNYTPALNDDTAVSFSYTVADGSLSAPGSATLDITPVNDAPVVSGPVTLAAIAEDSGVRLITQAELLANASDVDGPSLTATGLAIASGNGTLVDNGDGTWSYTPASNDDTSVSFSYTVSDGSLSAPGSASLDITPVNDAPTTTPVTLAAIAEDSGTRLITQAELLANASDVDGPSLTATGLAIASGNGTLVDNGDGTWSYTPASNDDTSVSFSYTVSDGSLSAPGSASLDITPVNDAAIDILFQYSGTPGNSLPNGVFGQLTAVDMDGGTPTYTYSFVGLGATTLTGGTVAASGGGQSYGGDLTVSSSGAISGSQLDDNRIYELTVRVTQGTATFDKTFNVITGTSAGNTINGTYVTGDDVIFAQGQGDTIFAGSGNDTVYGQSGADHIYGGEGNDTLFGGGGADTFHFETALNAATNVDSIVDFDAGEGDKIYLSTASGTPFEGLTYDNLAQHVVYDQATGTLSYDADGIGVGNAAIAFADLADGTVLSVSSANFILGT